MKIGLSIDPDAVRRLRLGAPFALAAVGAVVGWLTALPPYFVTWTFVPLMVLAAATVLYLTQVISAGDPDAPAIIFAAVGGIGLGAEGGDAPAGTIHVISALAWGVLAVVCAAAPMRREYLRKHTTPARGQEPEP